MNRTVTRTITRTICVLLGLLMTVGAALGISPRVASALLPGARLGVIVQLTPGQTVAGLNARHGTVTSATLAGKVGLVLITSNDARTDATLSAELSTDPAVVIAEPNLPMRSPEVAATSTIYHWSDGSPTAPGTQWAASTLRLGIAQQTTTGGGVTVAVLDTGLAAPTLAPWTVAGTDFVDGDAAPTDSANGLDDNADGVVDEAAGHGTFVAGIVHTTAPSASLMPVRVLDSDGDGTSFNAIQGMYWAADHGATVLNMSLGVHSSANALRQAVLDLAARNIVVVGAAGNESLNRTNFPAAAKCAVGVTSTGTTDRLSSFANWGDWIDVAAPGEAIVSLMPYAPSGRATWGGTSMSTPFVAGEVALIRAVRPTLSVQRVLDLVRASTVKVVSPPNNFGTAGRADVALAVAAVNGTSGPSGNDCSKALGG
jgi:subtilisin family serine protease